MLVSAANDTTDHTYILTDTDRPSRASTWQDDVYDRPSSYAGSGAGAGAGVNRSYSTRANPNVNFENLNSPTQGGFNGDGKPTRPTAPKPQFQPKATKDSIASNQAIALFTFDADQPGDLGFRKGEVITITKRTENKEDWWEGTIGGRSGTFPRYNLSFQ